MSCIDYSDARFKDNNPTPPHGRGLRDPTFTAGRLEHGKSFYQIRKKNQEAGMKRAQTRDRHRAQQANPQHPSQNLVFAPQPAASGPRPAPQTPRPTAPLPRFGPSEVPTLQRTPLQPVSLNAAPAYPSLNQLPSSSALYFPTPPSTQVLSQDGGTQWFASLSERDKAILLNSLKVSQELGRQVRMTNVRETYTPLLHTFTKISPVVLQLQSFDNDHGGIPEKNIHLDEEEDDSWGQQPSDGWGDKPDDGPVDRDEQLGPINMRTIEPSYPWARRRKRAADEDSSEEEDDDGEESPLPPKKIKKKSRSIAVLAEDHQNICDLAFNYLKIELALHMPFPVSVGRGRTARAHSDKFTELLLTVFTDAAFELDLENAKPTKADIALIRSRVPQFRSGLKATAREFVPGAYKLVDISSLDNLTQANINAQLEKNRHNVNGLLETFIYTNPEKITPETMFGHQIFQRVFTAYFFGDGEKNRASYFEGKGEVPFVTIALLVVAVLCAIEEWSTGRRQTQKEAKKFSHKNYFKTYEATLAGLKKWHGHCEKGVEEGRDSTNAATDLQERLLRVARYVSSIIIFVAKF
ncbi:hypothetical protein B0H19DRAFT_1245699 [Mycena capillaripes]|nr:hypothetical protein B0H19DRAFT_1245699 [Mycena capillaripes]